MADCTDCLPPAACVFQKVLLDALWSMLCWMTRVSTWERDRERPYQNSEVEVSCARLLFEPLKSGFNHSGTMCYLFFYVSFLPSSSSGTSISILEACSVTKHFSVAWAESWCDWTAATDVISSISCWEHGLVTNTFCFPFRSPTGNPEITRSGPDVSISQLSFSKSKWTFFCDVMMEKYLIVIKNI